MMLPFITTKQDPSQTCTIYLLGFHETKFDSRCEFSPLLLTVVRVVLKLCIFLIVVTVYFSICWPHIIFFLLAVIT